MNKHCAALLVASVLAASPAWAQKVSDDVVRIGVLTDLSGPNQDVTGAGSVVSWVRVRPSGARRQSCSSAAEMK